MRTETRGGRGKCAVCAHPKLTQIDQALVVEKPLRDLSKRFGMSVMALSRHRKHHLSPALAGIKGGRRTAGPTTAIERLERLISKLDGYVAASEKARSVSQALAAIRELHRAIELHAKMTGEFDDRPTTVVNLAASQEWIELRALVMKALAPYTEARRAVAEALAL